MSEILVNSIRRTGESASTPVTNIPKGWVSYDQTTPAVRNSENVSSVDDDATGQFGINFTNNMNGANYGAFMSCGEGSLGGTIYGIGPAVASPTASTLTGSTETTGAVDTDLPYDMASWVGDLA